MSHSKNYLNHVPNLRRYARAATGSVKHGDDVLADVVEKLSASMSDQSDRGSVTFALYAALTQRLLCETPNTNQSVYDIEGVDLVNCTQEQRVTYLLTFMEGFTPRMAQALLGASPETSLERFFDSDDVDARKSLRM